LLQVCSNKLVYIKDEVELEITIFHLLSNLYYLKKEKSYPIPPLKSAPYTTLSLNFLFFLSLSLSKFSSIRLKINQLLAQNQVQVGLGVLGKSFVNI